MSVENLAPTGIQFPDCPACSKSLYRGVIPAHYYVEYCCISFVLPLVKVKFSKELSLVKVITVNICVNRLVNVW